MEISFTSLAWEEYLYWQSTDNRMLKKIHNILKDISRNSPQGLGKPEALKGNLKGYFSRRLDEKNRLVYKVENDVVKVIQCGTHYRDK